MTKPERALHNFVKAVVTTALSNARHELYSTVNEGFIQPELEARNQRGETLKSEDIWVFQIMLYGDERPPEIRFNQEVKADMIGHSKPHHNREPGKVSQQEIETLDVEDLAKFVTRENEVGVSNLVGFCHRGDWHVGALELNRFILRSLAVIANAAGLRTCQADGCGFTFANKGKKIYCSLACGDKQRKKNYRRIRKMNG